MTVDLVVVERCCECKQPLPPKETHVYSVLVRLGSGAMKWLYSEPTTEGEAVTQARDLRATGHKVNVFTIGQAEDDKAKRARKNGKRK